MPARVVECRRRRDLREASHDVVPEKRTQRGAAGRRAGHGPQPRTDDEPLQDEPRVQLPARQLRPAPLPDDQREQRERRYQPAGRTLGHESDGRPQVHQCIACGLGQTGRGAVTAPRTQERQRATCQQRRIRRQPEADAQDEERAQAREGGNDRGRGPRLHAQRQCADGERGEEGVEKIGRTQGRRIIAEHGRGRCRHPVGQGWFFQERHAGKLRQRAVALQAHAPGDIRLTRLVRRPQSPPEHPGEPQRCQRQHDQHARGARGRRRTRQ